MPDFDFRSDGIDHVDIGVRDAEESRAFYAAALAPLGVIQTMSFPPEDAEAGGDQARARGWIHGFAQGANPEKPFFWVVGGATPGTALHVAFAAASRAEVDAFHAAALAAGGTDNGPPGLRPYHPSSYGAFVHDPNGYNVEAVCHHEE